MRYKLIVRPEAEQDIEDAFNWYENEESGVGAAFVRIIRSSIKTITTRPNSFPLVTRKTRRMVVDGFPYSIFFIVSADVIWITACIHQSRDPRVWKSRSPHLLTNKSELRTVYLEKRQTLSPVEHAELSGKIADLFFADLDLSSIKTVHCFISIKHKGEVETVHIFERLWNEFPLIRTLAPRIDHATGELEAFPFDPRIKLAENSWKVSEPADGEPVDPGEVDMVLVPLVCFDERGFRVGYGRGYYDRFLNKCRPDCLKIGLSFFSPVERIDDVHQGDVPLDLCVTPDGVYRRDAEALRMREI